MSSAETIVDVSDVHFAYGERQILKGIHLKVPRGTQEPE